MFEINIVAVLVATIVMTAVGVVWYSPMFFGKLWMREVKAWGDEMPPQRALAGKFAAHMFFQFVSLYILSYLVANIRPDAVSSVEAAGCIAIAMVLLYAGVVIWERRTVSYFWINALYHAVAIFGGIFVVIAWPW